MIFEKYANWNGFFLCVIFDVDALVTEAVSASEPPASFCYTAQFSIPEYSHLRVQIFPSAPREGEIVKIVARRRFAVVCIIAFIIGPVCWCERGCVSIYTHTLTHSRHVTVGTQGYVEAVSSRTVVDDA
jgi:hypothetical protein